MACSRLVSLATGWASSRLPWTKSEHRKIVIAASAFGNTNSALLMLVTAMCAQHSLPFFGALGDSCVKNVCLALCQTLRMLRPSLIAIYFHDKIQMAQHLSFSMHHARRDPVDTPAARPSCAQHACSAGTGCLSLVLYTLLVSARYILHVFQLFQSSSVAATNDQHKKEAMCCGA